MHLRLNVRKSSRDVARCGGLQNALQPVTSFRDVIALGLQGLPLVQWNDRSMCATKVPPRFDCISNRRNVGQTVEKDMPREILSRPPVLREVMLDSRPLLPGTLWTADKDESIPQAAAASKSSLAKAANPDWNQTLWAWVDVSLVDVVEST